MIVAYAKSKPIETIKEHTNKVLEELNILRKLYGKRILENKEIDEEKFWLTLKIACQYHDCGKIFTPFQNQILQKLGEELIETEFDYEIKHEQLSPLFIPQDLINKLDKPHQKILLQSIYYHHERDAMQPSPEVIEKIWQKDFLPRLDEIEKELEFPISKELRLGYLNKVSRENRIDEESEYYLEYCLIKGIVHRCDHAASAHIPVETNSKNNLGSEAEKFLEQKFKNINDLQEFCKENKNSNIIAVASTGYGKTEGAAIWSENEKTNYTLPYRISLNDIFDRINRLMNYENVGLLHSTAMDYLSEEDEIKYPQELYEQSRMMSTKILLSTINQFFYFVFKYQGYEKIYSMLSYTKIVIDEIQAYEPKITAIILKGLKMINDIGGKFMIITATLPKIYQEYLENNNIPLKVGKFYSNTNRHKIELIDKNISEAIEEIIEKSKNSKVLVIANTVDQAIMLYQKCIQKIDAGLLHARFIEEDKGALEEKIKLFARSNQNGVWITTQIVEASLDIDFDYLYTEMSTLDSLFQRMGRCYRKREYQGEESNIKIYIKNASGIKYVYNKKIHELSIQMLEKYNNQILKEKTKAELVEKLYSRETLKGTSYLTEFDTATRVLDNIVGYSLKEAEAKNILNDIKTVTVIPKQLYEENISLFEEYEKENDYKARNEILKKIRKLCLNLQANQAKRRISNVGYKIKDIYFIDAKYDRKKGLLLKEENNTFDDRSL